jgi:hypothetical protein
MPEVQKPVLEHAAPKANQNQGLEGRLADEATTLMQIPGPYFAIFEDQVLLPILTLLHRATVQALHTCGLEETPQHEVERWLDSLPVNPSVTARGQQSEL